MGVPLNMCSVDVLLEYRKCFSVLLSNDCYFFGDDKEPNIFLFSPPSLVMIFFFWPLSFGSLTSQ